MKPVWFVFGIISITLGALGVILPLLPTTPFILLAAFCLARSSNQFHAWLVGHKVFGPVILDWQTRGAIGQKAKRMATASIVLVFAISLFLGVPAYLLGTQVIVLGGVLLFIWSRPTS